MKPAAFLLALAGGLIALIMVLGVLFIVADESVQPRLGLAAVLAVAIIVAGAFGLSSKHTRNAGIVLIVLSCFALVFDLIPGVLVIRPLLFPYGLGLLGGVLALVASGR
jgi:hypothetical protein